LQEKFIFGFFNFRSATRPQLSKVTASTVEKREILMTIIRLCATDREQ